MTPQQWRDAVKGGTLLDKTFDVTVGQTKLTQFKIDAKGMFRSKSQSLKLKQPRGELTVLFNGDSDLEAIFNQFGMTRDPNSTGIHELPVQVETDEAVYQATFRLLYKNTRGTSGTAKGL